MMSRRALKGRLRPGMGTIAGLGLLQIVMTGLYANPVSAQLRRAQGAAAEPGVVAWRTHLPLRHVDSIRSYHLVGGYLYAMGSDNTVHAVRPDTGDYLWSLKLADELQTLWPPTAHRGPDGDDAVFTLLSEVLVLSPETGHIKKHYALHSTTNTCALITDTHLFEIANLGRIYCLQTPSGKNLWQMAGQKPITIPPMYLPSWDAILFADMGGNLVAISSDKTHIFTRNLKATPIGWLTIADRVIYAATNDMMLWAVDAKRGTPLWKYRLAGDPAGGPVVTRHSIYQATSQNGIHRIGIPANLPRGVTGEPTATAPGNEEQPTATAPEMDTNATDVATASAPAQKIPLPVTPNWRDAEARCFLAEWPEGIALLRKDGKITLIDPGTGSPMEMLDAGPTVNGVSNPYNDAIILTTPQGEIRCIRPVKAPPLQLANFQPPEFARKAMAATAAIPTATPASSNIPPAAKHTAGKSAENRAGTATTAPAPAVAASEELLLKDPLRSERRIRK